MNDRLRCPVWIGFFAGRMSMLCVGCMAAVVMLATSLWPLASPAAGQVNIGSGERSLSVSGGCIQIRAGDQTLTVGSCPKNGDGDENPEAPQSSESTIPEATGIEQSVPETTSPDQETTIEAPEGTEPEPEKPESSTPEAATPEAATPEATTTETAEPGPHSDDMVESGGSNFCPEPPTEGEAVRAVVARAIDGDTLELEKPLQVEGAETTDRVRMIGVDSPELSGEGGDPEPYAKEAAAFTADKLDGAEVWLATDKEPLDAYGRLLAYVWFENPSQNPPDATPSHSEESVPSASVEQPSGDEAEDEETMSLFNLALVEAGLAEAMAVEPNDAHAKCFDAASRSAEEAGLGIHSDHPEGEVPASDENTSPETTVSEQYASEDDTPNEPTPDEPTPDEPTPDEPTPDEPTSDEPTSDEPDAAVSEQYTPPEVTVETTLETTVMASDPEPPITTTEDEAPAFEDTVAEEQPPVPEDTVADESTTETLIAEEPVSEAAGAEELETEEPVATLDVPAPSAELVLEESPGTSETRSPSDEITVSEGAATLSVSAPAEPTYPAERASDHLAALPDTGGAPLARSSFGTLLIGLGLLASGVSLKLALRAGKTNSDAPSPSEERGGGGSDE